MSKPLVIVLDDDSAFRAILKEVFLSSLEVDVEETGDWHQINPLLTANTKRTVILISDVQMPGTDGYLVCQIIRKYYPTVRVIMLTGSDVGEVQRKLKQPDVPVVSKGGGPEHLIAVVTQALAA